MSAIVAGLGADGGRVVESGSHTRLPALGGRYAVAWRAQMGDRAACDAGEPSPTEPDAALAV